MRIFLIQSVQGLWPTAGEWISNVRFLKYLSSKGHATAQLCYGTQEEIARRLAESEKSPNDITFETDILEIHQKGQPPAQLPFTKFSTSDGIFMIVLDRDKFREHFPSVAFTGELKEADKVVLQLAYLYEDDSDGITEEEAHQDTRRLHELPDRSNYPV